MPTAIVVGGGVVGLCSAYRLLEAGWTVRIVADKLSPGITSDGAGALIMPETAVDDGRTRSWCAEGVRVFTQLAADSNPAVALRWGYHLLAGVDRTADPWWAQIVPGFRSPTPDERRRFEALGYDHVYVLQVPVVQMDAFLAWLLGRVKALGATVERCRLARLEDAVSGSRADLVVNCTGLGSYTLVPDPAMIPVRGQTVRVHAPWLDTWFLDYNGPNAVAYAIPRPDGCLLGGSMEHGSWNLTPDRHEATAIRARCALVEPRLADAQVVAHWVGLRPARTGGVRVERGVLATGVPVIHNYGHGSKGVCMAWGCARDVVQLANQIRSPITAAL